MSNRIKPTVIILGGGIGGLTVAHILINQGFDVTLFERNHICGGLARSNEKIEKECPNEYSWRAFGPYYNNLLSLLKQIPDNNKTIFNNLVPIMKGKPTGCSHEMPFGVDFNRIPYADRLTLINILLKGFMSCDERNIEELSNVNWSEYLKNHNASEETYKMAVRPLGPLFGYENNKASIYDVNNVSEIYFNFYFNPLMKKYDDFYLMNGPTTVKWFDPWVKYLVKKGVRLYTSSIVDYIYLKNGRIDSIDVKYQDQKFNCKADYFVCALSLESILALSKKSAGLWRADRSIRNLEPLYKYGRQVQLSMQFYFDKRAYFHNQYAVSYLPECPWGVTIEPEGTIWENSFDIGEYCKDNIKDIWSVGICEPDVPGLLIKKSFKECTPDEIAREVWYQIQHQPNFGSNVCIDDDTSFKDLYPVDYTIWHTFKYKDGKMDTSEPKFANNTHTKMLRPETKTTIPNFYFATAYCNTSVGIHSMEGATEAGMSASNAIIRSAKFGIPIHISLTPRVMPIVFGMPRLIDSVLYKLNLPHPNVLVGGQTWIILLLFIILIIFIIYFIGKKILK